MNQDVLEKFLQDQKDPSIFNVDSFTEQDVAKREEG